MKDKLIGAWVSQILNGSFSRWQIIPKKFNVILYKTFVFLCIFSKQNSLKTCFKNDLYALLFQICILSDVGGILSTTL